MNSLKNATLKYSIKEFNADRLFEETFAPCYLENDRIRKIIRSFKYNLNSVINVARVPFLISTETTAREMWRKVAIESGLTVDERDEIDRLFNEYFAGHIDEYHRGIDNNLIKYNLYLSSGSEYLKDNLLQCAVHIWSSFEVMIKQFTVDLLNRKPKDYLNKIRSNKYLKKRIQEPTIDLLAENSFDISKMLGDVLLGNLDFSNLSTMNAVTMSLLKVSVKSKRIYELNQNRHLVVHNSGFVDTQYMKAIKTSKKLDEKIEIESLDIDAYLVEIEKVLSKIFNSSNKDEIL